MGVEIAEPEKEHTTRAYDEMWLLYNQVSLDF